MYLSALTKKINCAFVFAIPEKMADPKPHSDASSPPTIRSGTALDTDSSATNAVACMLFAMPVYRQLFLKLPVGDAPSASADYLSVLAHARVLL